MIPKNISDQIEIKNKDIPNDTESLLNELGININCDLYEFYSKYNGQPIFGKYDELYDLTEIYDFEDYLHNELDVSSDFISLTSMEGEGFYLYSLDTPHG